MKKNARRNTSYEDQRLRLTGHGVETDKRLKYGCRVYKVKIHKDHGDGNYQLSGLRLIGHFVDDNGGGGATADRIELLKSGGGAAAGEAAAKAAPGGVVTVLVPGDTLVYRFTTRGGHSPRGMGWGFRFKVAPLRGLGRWRDEEEALRDASLDWACWILQFLMTDADREVSKTVHSTKVLDGLLRYLRNTQAPFKDRIMRLVAQLLRDPSLWPASEKPNTGTLASIERLALNQATANVRKSAVAAIFQPTKLLSVLEVGDRRSFSALPTYFFKSHPPPPPFPFPLSPFPFPLCPFPNPTPCQP